MDASTSSSDERFDSLFSRSGKEIKDSSLVKLNGALTNRAVYKKQGKSFGNKLLVSLPIINIIIPLVSIVASYLYAVDKNTWSLPSGSDVPFISDVGDHRPQSSLFTFGMALSSYTTLAIVIIRFWQVKHFLVKYDHRMNYASLIIGLLMIVGELLVISFQLSSDQSAHFVGAGMYFVFSMVYIVLQTMISYKNRSLYGKYQNSLIIVRVLLLTCMLIGMVLFGIFLIPSLQKYNRTGKSVSQSGEWLFAIANFLYYLSFVIDFWPLHPKLLLIKFERNTTESLLISNTHSEENMIPLADQKNGTNQEGTRSHRLVTIPETSWTGAEITAISNSMPGNVTLSNRK